MRRGAIVVDIIKAKREKYAHTRCTGIMATLAVLDMAYIYQYIIELH